MRKFISQLIISILVLLFFSPSLTAQNEKNTVGQDSVVSNIVNYACEELKKPEWSEKSPEVLENDIQALFGMIMLGNMPDLQREFGFNLDDEDKIAEVGDKIGMKLISDCPAFFALSLKAQSAQMNKEDGAASEEDMMGMYEMPTLEGEFVKIEGKDFANVIIKDADGKKHKFLWFASFEGSELLESNPKNLKGKKVIVGYNEFDHYVPSAKAYQKIAELASLKLKD
ncbi:MAG: hypothetical protein KA010_03025 [Saprospiraceae bacterium]|nr:hypothetical protein [Saprospiraceae bacterium]